MDWSGEWVAFVPEATWTPSLQPKTLRTIPEEIVVKGEKLIAHKVVPKGNQFDFAALFRRNEQGRTAYVFLSLESAAAQEVTLGFGADGWMEVWLNGERILSTMETGNITSPLLFSTILCGLSSVGEGTFWRYGLSVAVMVLVPFWP